MYKSKIYIKYNVMIETRKKKKKIVITSNYIPVEVITNLENNTPVTLKINKVNQDEIIGDIINN